MMTHLFGNSCCHYITYIVDILTHNVSIDEWGGHRQAGIIKNLLKYGREGMYVFLPFF